MNYKQKATSSQYPSRLPARPNPTTEQHPQTIAGSTNSYPSRRQALKKVFLAGAGAGVTGLTGAIFSPATQAADLDNSTLPPMPGVKNDKQKVVPTSPATPNTSYVLLSGLNFKPLISATSYSHINYSGVYPVANPNYFAAELNLPQLAKITEIEFYSVHNVGGTSTFQLAITYPSTGDIIPSVLNTLSAASSSVVTVTLNVPVNLPRVDNTSLKYVLYWSAAGTGNTEVLYGARVGYTGGTGRFGV